MPLAPLLTRRQAAVFRFVHGRTGRARLWAAESLVELDAADWPDDHRGSFLCALAPAALVLGREHQVPPSVILAQAVLESGWGRSALARHHHNLFGIKAGRASGVVQMATTEYRGPDRARVRARFRQFSSWSESLWHHARLLGNDERYRAARAHWADWRTYLKEIAPVYATDPAYVAHVGEIVRAYRLDRWDEIAVDGAEYDRTANARGSVFAGNATDNLLLWQP